MVLELTTMKIIQIIIVFIMAFSMGMKFDVSNKARKIANIIWITSLILLSVFILLE